MTAFTPGQPVTVHIGGPDNDPTGHEHKYHSDAGHGWVNVHGFAHLFAYPAEWVVPVTPPCPWTLIGTLIRADHGEIYELDARDRWRLHSNGTVVDWATDIAPHNPVRLVPEQPARKALRADGLIYRPIEGTNRYTQAVGMTADFLRDRSGEVTEVDDPAVTS